MSSLKKKSVFTTYTPIPPQISRQIVMDTLLSHVEMIDLNPLVIERHLIKAPLKATPEEAFCEWYEITDQVSYLPGVKGSVKSQACFTDLPNGIQTHIYAPMGLEIRGNWTLQGSLPGEPPGPRDLSPDAPTSGLYIREICEIRCSPIFTSFVKKTTIKAHEALVARFVQKSNLEVQAGARITNPTISGASGSSSRPGSIGPASPGFAPSTLTSSPSLRDSYQTQSTPPSISQQLTPGVAAGMPSPGLPPAFPSPSMQQQGFADPHLQQQQQQFQQFQQWQQFQQFQQQMAQQQQGGVQPSPHLGYGAMSPPQQQQNPMHFGAVEMSGESKIQGGPPPQQTRFEPVELPADYPR